MNLKSKLGRRSGVRGQGSGVRGQGLEIKVAYLIVYDPKSICGHRSIDHLLAIACLQLSKLSHNSIIFGDRQSGGSSPVKLYYQIANEA